MPGNSKPRKKSAPRRTHTYSRPILEVGVEQALMDVSVDAGKFLSRSGMYAW